jgi:hypothetical protein
MEATTGEVVEGVRKGVLLATIINHLKENRIEYAVFTLLAYSVGLLDKAMTYGQSICV